jgi:hypothetical protein
LDKNKILHQRRSYDIMGVLSDTGGMASTIIIIFSYIVLPVVSFSYNLKAMKSLYLADSDDPFLFLTKNSSSNKYSHLYDAKTHPNISPRS